MQLRNSVPASTLENVSCYSDVFILSRWRDIYENKIIIESV